MGKLCVIFGLERVDETERMGCGDRILDCGVTVSEQPGAVGTAHVDEFTTVYTNDFGAVCATRIDGNTEGSVQARGRVDTAGHPLLNAPVMLFVAFGAVFFTVRGHCTVLRFETCGKDSISNDADDIAQITDGVTVLYIA